MARVLVDLFAEDRAHEEVLKPLLTRIAGDEGRRVSIRVRAARGGHARAIDEFRLYQRLLLSQAIDAGTPELVVVAIDGNCTSWKKKQDEIRAATDPALPATVIAACPDPHIERWLLADPQAFAGAVGPCPQLSQKKCVRDYYKDVLARAVRQAGHPAMLGGIEFAPEIVAGMDLYRAGTNDRSLKHLIDDLRAALRTGG